MLRRLRWILGGFNFHNYKTITSSSSSKPPDARSYPYSQPQTIPQPKPIKPSTSSMPNHPPMLEAVHEIAIYIHRFHNLDLFQQGWYQIKITLKWEDDNYGSLGTPARVVQYEAPDLGADDICGLWRIDDMDHSFTTQPFRIRYARQDILLSVMISFNLSVGKYEVEKMILTKQYSCIHSASCMCTKGHLTEEVIFLLFQHLNWDPKLIATLSCACKWFDDLSKRILWKEFSKASSKDDA